MSWYAEAFTVPFIGIKGQAQLLKTAGNHNHPSTKRHTYSPSNYHVAMWFVKSKESVPKSIHWWHWTCIMMYHLDAAAQPLSVKLATHIFCSWANLKATLNILGLEICSDWDCRKLVTSVYYEPQHPLMLTSSFYMAYHFVTFLITSTLI